MISVAIVDDHPLFRQGLAMAVEEDEEFALAASAASIEDYDRLGVRPDIVLLDLHLPGIEGAAGVAHIRAGGPKVIVVSAAGTRDHVVNAIAAGAAGYLTKEADGPGIRQALRTVAGGQAYVSPTLASYLISADKQPGEGREYRLSSRELEVLGLLAAGEKDRDIAQQLTITTATVHSHLERIRDKTGARRRVELARVYLDRQKP
jgi:DNA-binding NarL/FixJ family response regulator